MSILLFFLIIRTVAINPKRMKSDNKMGMMILWLADNKLSSGGVKAMWSPLYITTNTF